MKRHTRLINLRKALFLTVLLLSGIALYAQEDDSFVMEVEKIKGTWEEKNGVFYGDNQIEIKGILEDIIGFLVPEYETKVFIPFSGITYFKLTLKNLGEDELRGESKQIIDFLAESNDFKYTLSTKMKNGFTVRIENTELLKSHEVTLQHAYEVGFKASKVEFEMVDTWENILFQLKESYLRKPLIQFNVLPNGYFKVKLNISKKKDQMLEQLRSNYGLLIMEEKI